MGVRRSSRKDGSKPAVTRAELTAANSASPATPWQTTTFGRISVLDVEPVVAGGARNAKATVGELVPIRATVFREGHDAVAAEAVVLDPQGREIRRVRMTSCDGVDRFEAGVQVFEMGLHSFRIDAFSDVTTTVMHRAEVKIGASVDVELEFAEVSLMLARAAAGAADGDSRIMRRIAAELTNAETPVDERLHDLRNPALHAALAANPIREFITPVGPFPLLIERQRALFGSWYEFFPRSEGAIQHEDGSWTSGTFVTAAARLAQIAEMGFDVVYLPPIHPIGVTNRKGRNNSLDAGPHDPGSPWAIGSAEGGHDAIHSDLGTIDDFRAFVRQATELGLEIALDLALQASPDHPWVTQHPEWFTTRADGTIAFAENPPKKYQDIYPMNFDNDPEGLYAEVLRIVRHWMAEGVRIFRVDNPHTKPVWFWECLIAEVNASDPDVIFLAEAFTKPPMMRALGEAGFQQSYTYFTWRNDKQGLMDYLTELSGPASAYMRPNFFANTPDILTEYLQHGGPAAFAIRAALAALLSPTWGIYSGFELFEHEAVRPGSEEYVDSEKYEYRPRNWARIFSDASGLNGEEIHTLIPYITALNRIRREHPALQQFRNLQWHHIDSPDAICFSKRAGDDVVVAVIATEPGTTIQASIQFNQELLALLQTRNAPAIEILSGEYVNLKDDPSIEINAERTAAMIFLL